VAASAGLLALGFRDTRPEPDGGAADEPGYFATLRAGLRHVRISRRVTWAVLIAAMVPAFSALDEYLPLITRATGVHTAYAPLMYAGPALAMAVGSALAGRWPKIGPRGLGLLIGGGAMLLVVGGLSGHAAGMLPIGLAFGILQFAMVITETRLQEATPGAVRATVLSVSGFAAEVLSVGVFAFFGLGAGHAGVPVLFALAGLPLLVTAAAVAARMPAPAADGGAPV
jgi:hypothetical protein